MIGSDPYDENLSYLQVVGISEVYVHEKFKQDGYGYDVGLVRLASKADFSRGRKHLFQSDKL